VPLARSFDRIHNWARHALAPLREVAAQVPAGGHVLDLGCGQGLLVALLCERAERVTGVDFDPRKCRMAREVLAGRPQAEIVEADIANYLTGLPGQSVDAVVLSDTLSSLPFAIQDEVLASSVRCLKPGGCLVLKIVDTEPPRKAALARAMFVLIYRVARASLSHEQRVFYRSHHSYAAKLAALGLDVKTDLLHYRAGHPIPHVLIVGRKRAAVVQPGATAPFRVRALVLNLRMGGQVAGALALCSRLRARGRDAELLLPPGLADAGKTSLDAFTRLPATTRLGLALRLLGQLRALAADPQVVLHLTLPAPSWSGLAALLPFPSERMVLQYEGKSLALGGDELRRLREDPGLLLPRLILNSRAWMPLGRSLACTHLATCPALADELERAGYARVRRVANFASLDDEPSDLPADLASQLADPHRVSLAYVGHAHPVKGLDDLLAAFAEVGSRRRDLRLVLALSGDGDSRRTLTAVARLERDHPGLKARISIYGLLPVGRLLKATDALVLPYRAATTTTLLPSLLLEADLAGCPTIVADLPELRPVLNWASRALSTFLPESVAGLAACLERTEKRVGRARDPLLLLPDEDTRLAELEQLYADLVTRSDPAANMARATGRTEKV